MPIHARKYKSMTLLSGGGSNTPLLTPKTEFTPKKHLDKQWVIDWVSYTFSDVVYEKKMNKFTDESDYIIMETKQNDYILNSILEIINYGKKWKAVEIKNKSVNGYKFSWWLGEHMRINFAGPKMSNGKPSTQILFSGSACRELELDFKGSFYELFKFLRSDHVELGFKTDENGEVISGYRFNGSFKRFDYSLDDFTGAELDIYDLKFFAENYYWTGPYRTVDIHSSSKTDNGKVLSKGFTMTFGSTGSNQLQIYDKLLEFISKKKVFSGSNTWYRYEMRFVNEKADSVVKEYIKAVETKSLHEFGYSLLKKQLKFRVPKKNDLQHKYRWKILPQWEALLKYVEELDLKVQLKNDRTYEKKKEWIDHSLITTFTQIYLEYRDDPEQFINAIFDYVKKGSLKFTEQHLESINKYLKDMGKPTISDKEFEIMKKRGLKIG
jgi:hypothetical protein